MPSTLSRRALLFGSALSLTPLRLRAAAPRRIVSIGGEVTEILYRLGCEDDIVGVDSTSQFPTDALKTKANVGYVRALGVEGVLSLAPSLVLATQGAGPLGVLQVLEQAGISLVRVPDDPSPAGIVRRVETIAHAVDAVARGAALVGEIEAGFTRLKEIRGKLTRPIRALFVLSLQNGKPLVGGRGTPADAILSLAGAENAAAALEGWKPLSDEGVIAAAPEAVVMMDRGPGGAPPNPFDLPAFMATPAAKGRKLVVMNGLYLLGFGPRTPAAARDLMASLHPELSRGTREILR